MWSFSEEINAESVKARVAQVIGDDIVDVALPRIVETPFGAFKDDIPSSLPSAGCTRRNCERMSKRERAPTQSRRPVSTRFHHSVSPSRFAAFFAHRSECAPFLAFLKPFLFRRLLSANLVAACNCRLNAADSSRSNERPSGFVHRAPRRCRSNCRHVRVSSQTSSGDSR